MAALNRVAQMHSELASVFEHIDRERGGSVDRLIDYLRHPSISAHNIGIRDVADRLVGMLTVMGLETITVPTAGHPLVLGLIREYPNRVSYGRAVSGFPLLEEFVTPFG